MEIERPKGAAGGGRRFTAAEENSKAVREERYNNRLYNTLGSVLCYESCDHALLGYCSTLEAIHLVFH